MQRFINLRGAYNLLTGLSCFALPGTTQFNRISNRRSPLEVAHKMRKNLMSLLKIYIDAEVIEQLVKLN